jgi:hypothetical protein
MIPMRITNPRRPLRSLQWQVFLGWVAGRHLYVSGAGGNSDDAAGIQPIVRLSLDD